MGRLKDILQQERKLNFAGRQKELDFFDQLLEKQQPSIHLLYTRRPGGQGKTTLLKQFVDRCKESSTPFIQPDCRYIELSPGNFKQAFLAVSLFPKEKVADKLWLEENKII